jgi:hypothetical protein
MTQFFDWQTLATFAGAVAATGVIVQFLKNVDFVQKLPSQLVSYIIALIILYASYFFTGKLDTSTAVILIFDGIAVSVAANGTYDAIKKATIAASEKAIKNSNTTKEIVVAPTITIPEKDSIKETTITDSEVK